MKNLYKNFYCKKNSIHFELNDYFFKNYIVNENFFVNYSCKIDSKRESIINIPLILNIVPVIWALNIEFCVNEIDSNLFHSLNKIKDKLKLNYPDLEWNGKIHYHKLVNNSFTKSKSSYKNILFSGGIDSFFTFFSLTFKNTRLLMVRGADIKLDDDDGWFELKKRCNNIKENYKVNIEFIETNILSFLNSDKLNFISPNITDWWSYVQHGPGFVSLAAPINKNYTKTYISATHSIDFNTPWGSSPDIDNLIKYLNHKVIHFGYDFTRQEKINEIIKVIRLNKLRKPVLRVCYKNKNISSQNCCRCEKCYRTITGLIMAGGYPKDFGFEISLVESYLRIKKTFQNNEIVFDANRLFMWQDIQNNIGTFEEDNNVSEIQAFVSWFKNFDFDQYLFKNKRKKTLMNNVYQFAKKYKLGRLLINTYKKIK